MGVNKEELEKLFDLRKALRKHIDLKQRRINSTKRLISSARENLSRAEKQKLDTKRRLLETEREIDTIIGKQCPEPTEERNGASHGQRKIPM
jgi:predicted  nucleic acid-binding Zn-ribbon protein